MCFHSVTGSEKRIALNRNWYFIAALVASGDGVKVFKFSKWRNKGVILPEVMEAYKSVEAELNVLPFCTQFIPMDVINFPKHKSICYHPSLLPRHRGASAINWSVPFVFILFKDNSALKRCISKQLLFKYSKILGSL